MFKVTELDRYCSGRLGGDGRDQCRAEEAKESRAVLQVADTFAVANVGVTHVARSAPGFLHRKCQARVERDGQGRW